MSISVVIPVYNDTTALADLLKRLFRSCDGQRIELEVLLVDDGSGNDAWQWLRKLKATHPGRRITLLRLARNSGQHNATLCGLAHAHGDVVVTMDADLQHPPEAVPLLLARLQANGLDLVYGTAQTGHAWPRRLATRVFRLLTRPLGGTSIDGSAFRAIRAGLARELVASASQPFVVVDSFLQKAGNRIEVLPVDHQRRAHGRSSYTFGRLLLMALRIIAAAPEFPRLLLLLAATAASAGLALLFRAGLASNSGTDALRALALLAGALFLAGLHHQAMQQRTQAHLGRRFVLQEKIE